MPEDLGINVHDGIGVSESLGRPEPNAVGLLLIQNGKAKVLAYRMLKNGEEADIKKNIGL